MNVNIRRAVKSDVASILFLIRELAIFENEPKAVIVTQAQIEKDGFGARPLFECFVAEVAIKLSVWHSITRAIPPGRAYFPLRGFDRYGADEGQGDRNAFIPSFLKHAHQEGVERVEWAVLDWNLPAIEFYKKSGAFCWTIGELCKWTKKYRQLYLKN